MDIFKAVWRLKVDLLRAEIFFRLFVCMCVLEFVSSCLDAYLVLCDLFGWAYLIISSLQLSGRILNEIVGMENRTSTVFQEDRSALGHGHGKMNEMYSSALNYRWWLHDRGAGLICVSIHLIPTSPEVVGQQEL